MKINRILSVLLIVIGVVLLGFGIAATQRTGEKIVGEITGNFTNQTMWYIIGGIAFIIGGFGVKRIGK